MYGSFFAGSYGLKFLNGESAAPPVARTGVAGAFDLVFISCCAESLDCLTGDCFRAAGAVLTLERVAGDFARAGLRTALAFAGALLPARPLAAADFAADFAAGFAAEAAGLATALRAVARAEDLLAGARSADFLLVAFLAGVRWLPVPLLFVLVLPAAVLFTAAFFRDVVAVPLPFAFVVVAAMVCLWFLTFGRARELLTPGISKGA
ncbi:MAG TPA: hypothetical protein VF210_18985 [Pseudomonadales bacterium]